MCFFTRVVGGSSFLAVPLRNVSEKTKYRLPKEAWSSTWETDSNSGPGVFEPHPRMHGDPPQPVGYLDI
jgi:hypothetical protein